LVPASDGGDDLIGIGGPDEGFGVIVRLSNEAFDRALEIDEGSEDAALETSLAQLGEEALDSIEPGDRFRRVVEDETGMAFKPTPHLGCLWLP
jgi:hypothetical protein